MNLFGEERKGEEGRGSKEVIREGAGRERPDRERGVVAVR
jgi:hypothetical protein